MSLFWYRHNVYIQDVLRHYFHANDRKEIHSTADTHSLSSQTEDDVFKVINRQKLKM